MKVLRNLYNKVMSLASRSNAKVYLAMLSFAEASFFPVPPDVMLAPMILAKPNDAFKFARITILFSTFGGVFGYILGNFAFDPIVFPFIKTFGYEAMYYKVLASFKIWGFWILCCVGCVPIPYKLFSISAGFLKYNVMLFIVASIIGRCGRFFLVATIMKKGNEKVKHFFGKILRIEQI